MCALTIVPFYWMFTTSLKSPNEIFEISLLPDAPSLNNYAYMFGRILTTAHREPELRFRNDRLDTARRKETATMTR